MENVQKAIKVLDSGRLVLYPTDTQYAIGADATNQSAVEKIFEIKKRDKQKALSVCVESLEKANDFAIVTDLAKKIAEKFLPGPLTLVLEKREENNLAKGVGDKESIAIRIPDNKFCLKLLKEFGKPITATSANISGKEIGQNVSEILDQFGNKDVFDLVIEGGDLSGKASTIIDCRDQKPVLIREGAINFEDILKAV